MLTGQRKNECAALPWAELSETEWSIPPERHKSKRLHVVPLTKDLSEIFAAIPRTGDYLFTTRPDTPIVPGDKLKKRIDAETGLTGWTFHDIRRSAATRMAEGGVARFDIERVLGHADLGISGVYDRHHYFDEKKRALEVLAETVRDV